MPGATSGVTSPIFLSALWYSSRKRWQLVPLHSLQNGICSCRRPDCSSPGKHPLTANGLLDASKEPGQIQEWWTRWPFANVGIVTGPASGLFVLDVDDKNGGMDSIATLPVLPDTVVCLTGGGGLHYFFKYPEGPSLHNSAGLLGPGLDTRGDGGYVVAAPSIHISGHAYSWELSCRPDSVDIAAVPAWMLDRLLQNGTRRSMEPVEGPIGQGLRDTTLASMAGTMRRRGFSERAILAALTVENEDRVVPPLADDDLRRIAQSVGRYSPEIAKSEGWQGW